MIYESIIIAIVAFVYSSILTEQGMILNWFYRLICKFPAPLHKPLISCPYCVAGQMALWLYLYRYHDSYSLIDHIVLISLAIFFEHVILTANYKVNGTN